MLATKGTGFFGGIGLVDGATFGGTGLGGGAELFLRVGGSGLLGLNQHTHNHHPQTPIHILTNIPFRQSFNNIVIGAGVCGRCPLHRFVPRVLLIVFCRLPEKGDHNGVT